MKKILLALISAAMLFASNADNEDINKKLDLLIQKINQLEKKVNQKDAQINQLKKELQKQQKEITQDNKKVVKKLENQIAVKSCRKISVFDFSDQYYNEIIPYYMLDFKLKNNYPKKIVYLEGNLFAEDSDGVKILQDFIKRKVDFPAGGVIHIHKKHIVDNSLEDYLKDSDPKKLRIYFVIIKAVFADGKTLECGL